MAYQPENNLRKLRRSLVYSGTGVQISATGTALDVSALVVPCPGGTDDFFAADVDDTGAPNVPIPAAGVPVAIPFVDFATVLAFTSIGVIFRNLSGVPLWISFAGGIAGSFHRVNPGTSIAWDQKGATAVSIRDPSGVGGQAYNLHAWG